MPKYKINQPMPWQDILHLHRWYLGRKIRHYHVQCDVSQDNEDTIEFHRQAVRESYQMYNSLRLFLGYYAKTKIEQEALNIIQKSDGCT